MVAVQAKVAPFASVMVLGQRRDFAPVEASLWWEAGFHPAPEPIPVHLHNHEPFSLSEGSGTLEIRQ